MFLILTVKNQDQDYATMYNPINTLAQQIRDLHYTVIVEKWTITVVGKENISILANLADKHKDVYFFNLCNYWPHEEPYANFLIRHR
jgi:hypothetical protein